MYRVKRFHLRVNRSSPYLSIYHLSSIAPCSASVCVTRKACALTYAMCSMIFPKSVTTIAYYRTCLGAVVGQWSSWIY